MFVLRKVFGSGTECDTALGESYNLIKKKESPKEFKRCERLLYEEAAEPEVYAYITYNRGKDITSLFVSQLNYIMYSNGQTFRNVTSPERQDFLNSCVAP